MSFAEFFDAIRSPDLKQVARHWNEWRGAKTLPGWNDVEPSKIAAQLPLIWVYRYDRESELFTGRLAGYHIEEKFGKSFRNTPMTEIYPPADYPRLYARARRVVCEPAFYRGEGTVFRHVDRYGLGERIMMPLADDGTAGDGVFGVTIYQSHLGNPADGTAESEDWFTL